MASAPQKQTLRAPRHIAAPPTRAATAPKAARSTSALAVTTLAKYGEMFDGAIEKSNKFPRYYAALAGWEPVEFFDAGSVIRSSDLDGIHFDAAEHAKLGAAVAAKIRAILV